MTVDVDVRHLVVAGVLGLILAFGILGRFVTPVEAEKAQVLTPVRWHAMRLAWQAARETDVLARDAQELKAMLAQERPSAVDAMLLAERIYAHHRRGTMATAAARDALIQAARIAALYTAGIASREEAETALGRALDLIRELRAQQPREQRPEEYQPRNRERQSLPYIAVGAW